MTVKSWIYKKETHYSFWAKDFIECFNIPYFRSPSNYKLVMRIKDTSDELRKQGYNIKTIVEQDIKNYNSYEDIYVSANKERKSWKRNSKRKHQWKSK